jgi:hypothetical protein
MKIRDILVELASEGATATPNVSSGTPVANHSKGKSYTGTPGKSGTKAPKQQKPKAQSPKDNALDGDKLMAGQGVIKRG